MKTRFGRPTARRSGTSIIGVVLALVLATAAFGQGTSGTVPDPISTPELIRYADRLQLSDEQRQAFTTFHDAYKREFKALRDGEIAEFMGELQAIQGTMPSREELHRVIKRMGDLLDRVERVDRRLFDDLSTILTDEQIVELPRVRTARARTRYMSNQMSFAITGGSGLADLSRMVEDLDELSADERMRLDPLLRPYEAKLTSESEKIYRGTMSMWLDIFDRVLDAGFDESAIQDPERAAEFQAFMMEVFAEVSGKVRKRAADVVALNRRTYQLMMQQLEPSSARRLQRSFMSEQYRNMPSMLVHTDAALDAAAAIDDITPEQQAEVDAIVRQYEQTLRRVLREGMDLADEMNASRDPFQAVMPAEDSMERLRELQAEIRAAYAEVFPRIGDVIGEELATRVATGGAAPPVEAPATEVVQAETLEQAWQIDPFVAAAISRRDMGAMMDRLGLEGDERSLATSLHETYREAYAAFGQDELRAITTITSSLWRQSPDGGYESPDDSTIDALLQARRHAIRRLDEIEEAFFDDLDVAVLDEASRARLPQVRRARERQRYATSSNLGMGSSLVGYRSHEGTIDLLALAETLDDVTLESSDALDAYEVELIDILKRRRDGEVEQGSAQVRWNVVASEITNSGQPNAFQDRYIEVMGPSEETIRACELAMRDLNRRTLALLSDTADPADIEQLESAYRRAAYPEVYAEAIRIETQIDLARQRPDLTEAQRAALGEAALEFRAGFDDIAQRMIDMLPEDDAMSWATQRTPEDWKRIQALRDALGRLGFERDEVVARTSARLDRVLGN